MSRVSSLLIALVAACMLVLAGCGDSASDKIAEKIAEGASGADVDIDKGGNSVKITGKDGEKLEIAGSDGKLPEDWPEDVPLPDGAKITNGGSMSSGEGTMYTAEAMVDESASDVISFFKKSLSDYKEVFTSSQDGTATGSYDNGTNAVTVSATEDGGTTTLSVVVAPTAK